jgi:hypothetical protein
MKGFKPEDGYMKGLARKKYREVMNQKNTRLAQWLDQWEDAIVEGIRYDIPEIQDGIWLSDLADRIQPYSEYQAGTIRAEARDENKKDVERFREKARTLRQDLKLNQGGRILRGSAYEVTLDQLAEEEEADRSEKVAKRKRSTAIGTSPEASMSKKLRLICEACGAKRHSLPDCWGVFEELRPEGTPISKYRKQKVEKALKENASLKVRVEEIRQMRKVRGLGEEAS